MGYHSVKSLVGLFRKGELDDFHLVELVQAVKAPNVLSVRSGLTPEALSIGGHLYREVLLRNDTVSVNIGYRHLSRRNHIELVQTYIIHLLSLVRKLTGCIG